jgi:hypothetical protein
VAFGFRWKLRRGLILLHTSRVSDSSIFDKIPNGISPKTIKTGCKIGQFKIA